MCDRVRVCEKENEKERARDEEKKNKSREESEDTLLASAYANFCLFENCKKEVDKGGRERRK